MGSMIKSKADVLRAWLHDPPDRALARQGREERARRYLAEALGFAVSELERREVHAAPTHSQLEQLPLPTSGPNGERDVEVEERALSVYHPLSAEPRTLDQLSDVDEEGVLRAIRQIIEPHDGEDERFFALWRMLPEKLSETAPYYAALPADPRVPDHTIWHRLDINAGLQPALAAPGGGALLFLSIGPVQPFIAAAQSVRDLWSGSMILSYMAFQAMLPIIERLGPTAIVFPALRGAPMLDLWMLHERKRKVSGIPEPAGETRKSPCLPNRFLAAVPYGPGGDSANDLLQTCIEGARKAWRELAGEVRSILRKKWGDNGIDTNWDYRWDEQIETFFDVRGTATPLNELAEDALCRLLGGDALKAIALDAAQVRSLAEAIRPEDQSGGHQGAAGLWQLQNEVAVRILESHRGIRHVPNHTESVPDEKYPQKCSLMGSFEQMGPAEPGASKDFWDNVRRYRFGGISLGSRERLCAVSLTKRFAPLALAEKLRLDPRELRYYDTATVAAADWLESAKNVSPGSDGGLSFDYTKIDGWNGQWLHWTGREADKEDPPPDDLLRKIQRLRSPRKLRPPPLYYAVLMIDGDEMGEWLAGRKSPTVGEVLHPTLREYFAGLAGRGDADRVERGLAARRPQVPACHAAISEALANFAVHVVPRIVQNHEGTLVYAGGDDVLALLPCRQALPCANALALAFQGDPAVNNGAPRGYYSLNTGESDTRRELLMMGPKATVSAGIAVVHYKEDLRFALEAARRAERKAKDGGRNTAQLMVCRRSGEHGTALCPWELIEFFQRLVGAFCEKASDRWAYHLRREEPTLAGHEIPKALIEAEIRRQVGRVEDDTRKKLARAFELPNADKATVSAQFVNCFDQYYQELQDRGLKHDEVLRGFITLCQSASFLARGGREI